MTESKRHDAAEDERARAHARKRHENTVRLERERFARRLSALGPGPQYTTEFGCVVDGAPVVGSPEWWEAA